MTVQQDSSLTQTDRHTELAMNSIVFNYDKKLEVENTQYSSSKPKEQTTDRYAGKPYERRNKKRRPPDYYQKYDEAAQLTNVTDQSLESRPLMWHEEVEQSLPLLDNQTDNLSSTAVKTSHGQMNQDTAGFPSHSRCSAQIDSYPKHQNFSANFPGTVSVHQLISTQPEFIPPARSSEMTHSPNTTAPRWQQRSADVCDSPLQNSAAQFSAPVSNFSATSYSMPSSMHYTGASQDNNSHGHSDSVKGRTFPEESRSKHSESQSFDKVADQFSSLQMKNVTVISNTSSSSHPAPEGSSSVNPECAGESLSFVASVSSQKLSEPDSEDYVDVKGPTLPTDHVSPRADLDPDQYPTLGKMGGGPVEDIPQDSSMGSVMPNTTPQSVPQQASKPKSASWAGLFSNVDPAKQGFVVTNWAPTPSTSTAKPSETPQTAESREPDTPVDVTEDPLAKTFGGKCFVQRNNFSG